MEESLKAGASVAVVARANGVNVNQVFAWRKLYREGQFEVEATALLPVKISETVKRRRGGRKSFEPNEQTGNHRYRSGPCASAHPGPGGSDAVEATHDLVTATMKRCPKCGYGHLENGVNLAEVCDRCGAGLEASSRIDHLVHLQNVSLKQAERITCDEEERQRFGYRLVTSYRFPEIGGKLDRKDAEIYCDSTLAVRLNYGDVTDLYRINLG